MTKDSQLWQTAKSRWIAVKNLESFRQKLAEEQDRDKRRILTELIAQEEQKLCKPEDRKSTRLNSSHYSRSRMPSSA